MLCTSSCVGLFLSPLGDDGGGGGGGGGGGDGGDSVDFGNTITPSSSSRQIWVLNLCKILCLQYNVDNKK